jgi:hypothetical protein
MLISFWEEKYEKGEEKKGEILKEKVRKKKGKSRRRYRGKIYICNMSKKNFFYRNEA